MDAFRRRHFFIATAISMLCIVSASSVCGLTLRQAELAALRQSPEIKSFDAQSRALKESAVAAGQLSDPQLVLGAMNVPVDSFNFSEVPMTQVQVGVKQNFPRGRSLRYQFLQKNNLSNAEVQKCKMMRLKILREVRVSWLHLYYWMHARELVLKQKKIFRHLVKVTESMLANNQAQQKDAIRAQLELTELDNRLLEIDQEIETSRAQLARWIGPALAHKIRSLNKPHWLPPPHLRFLQYSLRNHPVLQSDQALVSAGKAGIKLAKQQYKPGFAVAVVYGFRSGEELDGSRRSDFLSAQLGVDLPLFTRNRQDRTFEASKQSLIANEENQRTHYRELKEMLAVQYSAWQQNQKSAALYKSKLIPEAKHYSTATLTAYQNTQTDFPTLARAYVRELNTELAGLKSSVDRDVARAHLFYLQGYHHEKKR